MKSFRNFALLFFLSGLVFFATSCSVFAPKYGCPGNGKNVGAERILSGEKVPKARKFKA
jgi:hypothetical protein